MATGDTGKVFVTQRERKGSNHYWRKKAKGFKEHKRESRGSEEGPAIKKRELQLYAFSGKKGIRAKAGPAGKKVGFWGKGREASNQKRKEAG